MLGKWGLPVAALIGGVAGAATMYLAGGSQIRSYLIANPEVITDALQHQQDRATGRLVAAHRGEIVPPYRGAWAGNPQGDVTVVEYYDYNCGYCRASLPALNQLLARDGKVKLVYRELPILAPESRAAAVASLAAAAAGPAKFRAFHAALYAGGPTTPASIAAAARATGVNIAAVPADAEAEIARNIRMASTIGLTGTPSWVIGDRVLIGAQPIEALEAAVAAARAR